MSDPATLLATPDQFRLERVALDILATPEMRAQVAASIAQCEAAPQAASADGKRTLRSMVEELAGWAAMNAATSDTHRPGLVWTITPPRMWNGYRVPGTRWIFDNPDNVYRYFVLDGASRYRLTCRPNGPRGSFSVLVYSYFTGEEGKKMEGAHAGLLEKDMVVADDGSIVITLDAEPANGRPNHLHIQPDARLVMIREALFDWTTQRPQQMTIERVDDEPLQPPPTLADMTAFAVKLLTDATVTVINFESRYSPLPTNAFAKTVQRSAGFGLIKLCRFDIADDEALVVTAEDLGGKYRAASIDTPWLVTVEHVHRNGSLNNGQVETNADGSCTYVVAPRDPGIANWLDTGGLNRGGFAVRWENLAKPVEDPNAAIREMRVVKIADLDAALPPGTRRVSRDERRTIAEARAASWRNRVGNIPCEPLAGFDVENA